MSDTYTEFGSGRYNEAEVKNQGYGMVDYAGPDDRKFVLFYNRSVHQPMASREQGRPVYKDIIYFKCGDPGEMKLNLIDRPATDDDKRKWPRHWAQFQNNAKQAPEGTPVAMLFPEKPSVIDMLRSYGVHTVEQLAHLSAEGMATVGMGAMEWVNKAKSYVEKSEKGVGFHKMQSELKARDTEIAVLKENQALLQQQISLLMSKQPGYVPPPMQLAPSIENFDAQEAQINAAGMDRDFTLPPTAFDNAITPEPKRRGRPPKNKETA